MQVPGTNASVVVYDEGGRMHESALSVVQEKSTSDYFLVYTFYIPGKRNTGFFSYHDYYLSRLNLTVYNRSGEKVFVRNYEHGSKNRPGSKRDPEHYEGLISENIAANASDIIQDMDFLISIAEGEYNE
jgi:hypothetical protein